MTSNLNGNDPMGSPSACSASLVKRSRFPSPDPHWQAPRSLSALTGSHTTSTVRCSRSSKERRPAASADEPPLFAVSSMRGAAGAGPLPPLRHGGPSRPPNPRAPRKCYVDVEAAGARGEAGSMPPGAPVPATPVPVHGRIEENRGSRGNRDLNGNPISRVTSKCSRLGVNSESGFRDSREYHASALTPQGIPTRLEPSLGFSQVNCSGLGVCSLSHEHHALSESVIHRLGPQT